MWFNKKKCQFLRFSSFRFCPIPKIENLKISERFYLRCDLIRKKCPFPRFPFCPKLEIENLVTSESFRLVQIFIVSVA